MRQILMAISGPSGVGKGTLVNRLLLENDGLVASVSCTTRPPRAGEVDGRDYFFLTREEFDVRIASDDFLEYDYHFGSMYGTPRSFVERQLKERSVILEIDVVGALKVKEKYPETVLIMIVPPSMEELENRLDTRGSETKEQIKKRLERVRYELSLREKYDYVVVNDDLESSKQKLLEIIRREQNK